MDGRTEMGYGVPHLPDWSREASREALHGYAARKAQMKYSLRTPSGSLTGVVAHSAREGGKLPWSRLCDCKPPKVWEYPDGEVPAYLRGSSCVHIVGDLVHWAVRSGMTFADLCSIAFDRAHKGFAWLWFYEVEDDSPRAVLERWYERSASVALTTAKKAARRAARAVKKSVGVFEYHLGGWSKILGVLERSPGLGRNELLHHMLVHYRWRHGVTKKYLAEGKRLGYISAAVSGPRGKQSFSVLAWPEPPKRPVYTWWGDFMTGEIKPGRTGHLTLSQIHYLLDRGTSVDEVAGDLQWHESRAKRNRRRKAMTPAAGSVATGVHVGGRVLREVFCRPVHRNTNSAELVPA